MNSPFTKLKYLHVMLLKTPIPNRNNIYLITCRLSGLQLGTVSEKNVTKLLLSFWSWIDKTFSQSFECTQ